MQNLIRWRKQMMKPGIWGMVLLVALCLAGCGRLPFGDESDSPPAQLSATASNQGNAKNVSLALQPASGYGGLYVQVNGTNWPQNMMVLVTLEDTQGRSETLAASDTDPAGNLTTGFLFPIDERWLASESPWVVTTSADGSVEAKAQFTVVPPGAEIDLASSSTNEPDAASPADGGEGGTPQSDPEEVDSAKSDEELANKLILPLVASSGVERGGSRAGRSSSAAVIQIAVDVKPSGSKTIDCRKGQEWIEVVIFSDEDFDATSVDAGSVLVAGGSSDLGQTGGLVENTFVALAQPRAVQRNLQAYQWQWHLDDVNGDGKSDMVMEFRFAYTELTCDAVVVAVTGRTKDGARFEGTNRVKMLALERG